MDKINDPLSKENLAVIIKEMAGALRSDTTAVSSVLTPFASFGWNLTMLLEGLGTALETDDRQRLMHNLGPIATRLRMDAMLKAVKADYMAHPRIDEHGKEIDPWSLTYLEDTIREMSPYFDADSSPHLSYKPEPLMTVAEAFPSTDPGSRSAHFAHYFYDVKRLPQSFSRAIFFLNGRTVEESVKLRSEGVGQDRMTRLRRYDIELILPKLPEDIATARDVSRMSFIGAHDLLVPFPLHSYTLVSLRLEIKTALIETFDQQPDETERVEYVTDASLSLSEVVVQNALEKTRYKGDARSVDYAALAGHVKDVCAAAFGLSASLLERRTPSGLKLTGGTMNLTDVKESSERAVELYQKLIGLGEVQRFFMDLASEHGRLYFGAPSQLTQRCQYDERLALCRKYEVGADDEHGKFVDREVPNFEVVYMLAPWLKFKARIRDHQLQVTAGSDFDIPCPFDVMAAEFILELMLEQRQAFFQAMAEATPIKEDRRFTTHGPGYW